MFSLFEAESQWGGISLLLQFIGWFKNLADIWHKFYGYCSLYWANSAQHLSRRIHDRAMSEVKIRSENFFFFFPFQTRKQALEIFATNNFNGILSDLRRGSKYADERQSKKILQGKVWIPLASNVVVVRRAR